MTISRRQGCRTFDSIRPIDDASLARNPFRVFLLTRLELIENEILRQKAAEILRQRDISPHVVDNC
ncbi:2-oxoadipate dioxygenase/decarboxylase family protein [Shigella flexneri]